MINLIIFVGGLALFIFGGWKLAKVPYDEVRPLNPETQEPWGTFFFLGFVLLILSFFI